MLISCEFCKTSSSVVPLVPGADQALGGWSPSDVYPRGRVHWVAPPQGGRPTPPRSDLVGGTRHREQQIVCSGSQGQMPPVASTGGSTTPSSGSYPVSRSHHTGAVCNPCQPLLQTYPLYSRVGVTGRPARDARLNLVCPLHTGKRSRLQFPPATPEPTPGTPACPGLGVAPGPPPALRQQHPQRNHQHLPPALLSVPG